MKNIDQVTGRRRGSALVIVLIATLTLGMLGTAFMAMTQSASSEERSLRRQMVAGYVNEAALREAAALIAAGGRPGFEAADHPRELDGVRYTVTDLWGEDDPALDSNLVQLRSTTAFSGREYSMELVLRRGVLRLPSWDAGVLGLNKVTLDSNAYADSFDASVSDYASQITGSFGSQTIAGADAVVQSNGPIVLSSNSTIQGDGTPGAYSTVTTRGTAVVSGSTAPLVDAVALPLIATPSYPGLPGVDVATGNTTIPSGNYSFAHLHATGDGVVTVVGPANVVLGDFLMDSSSELVLDTSGGPVNFYVEGRFEISSNNNVGATTGLPTDTAFHVTGSGDPVVINSNVEFTGTIFAPDRVVHLDSNTQVFGAVAGMEVEINSNASVHYDVSLQSATTIPAGPGARALTWRRVARNAP